MKFWGVSSAAEPITIGEIFHSIWPFMALQVVALGIVMTFPQLALWLPNTMIGK